MVTRVCVQVPSGTSYFEVLKTPISRTYGTLRFPLISFLPISNPYGINALYSLKKARAENCIINYSDVGIYN